MKQNNFKIKVDKIYNNVFITANIIVGNREYLQQKNLLNNNKFIINKQEKSAVLVVTENKISVEPPTFVTNFNARPILKPNTNNVFQNTLMSQYTTASQTTMTGTTPDTIPATSAGTMMTTETLPSTQAGTMMTTGTLPSTQAGTTTNLNTLTPMDPNNGFLITRPTDPNSNFIPGRPTVPGLITGIVVNTPNTQNTISYFSQYKSPKKGFSIRKDLVTNYYELTTTFIIRNKKENILKRENRVPIRAPIKQDLIQFSK
jgi:hypothetical protein